METGLLSLISSLFLTNEEHTMDGLDLTCEVREFFVSFEMTHKNPVSTHKVRT